MQFIANLYFGISGRDKRILLSVAAALLSKGASMLLQLVSLPLLVRSLGLDRYAVFSVITGVIGSISMAQLGVGGFVVRSIGTARTRNDGAAIKRTLRAAIVVVMAVLVAASLIVFGVIGIPPIAEFLGLANFSAKDIGTLVVLAWIIGSIMTVCDVFAKAQLAFEEQYRTSLMLGAANLVSGGMLYLALRIESREVWFLVSLYAPVVMAQILIAWTFCQRHIISICEPAGSWSFSQIWQTLRIGALYFVYQSLYPWLHREAPKLVLLATLDHYNAGVFSVLMQISVISFGMVSIVTQPVFGALAAATGDIDWVKRRFKFLVLGGCLFGVCFVPIFTFCGNSVLHLIDPSITHLAKWTLLTFSAYFSVMILVHVLGTFVLALGGERWALVSATLEALALVALVFARPLTSVSDVYLYFFLTHTLICAPLMLGFCIKHFRHNSLSEASVANIP